MHSNPLSMSSLARRAALAVALVPAALSAQAPTPAPSRGADSSAVARDAGAVPSSALPAAQSGGPIPVDRVVAVVGTQPILLSDVFELVNVKRAQGLSMPADSAGQAALLERTLNELVDEEVMVQRAKAEKIEVTDADVAPQVDAQIKRVREQFKSEAEYREELKRAGFGTP